MHQVTLFLENWDNDCNIWGSYSPVFNGKEFNIQIEMSEFVRSVFRNGYFPLLSCDCDGSGGHTVAGVEVTRDVKNGTISWLFLRDEDEPIPDNAKMWPEERAFYLDKAIFPNQDFRVTMSLTNYVNEAYVAVRTILEMLEMSPKDTEYKRNLYLEFLPRLIDLLGNSKKMEPSN